MVAADEDVARAARRDDVDDFVDRVKEEADPPNEDEEPTNDGRRRAVRGDHEDDDGRNKDADRNDDALDGEKEIENGRHYDDDRTDSCHDAGRPGEIAKGRPW